jgi:hypothetical protein
MTFFCRGVHLGSLNAGARPEFGDRIGLQLLLLLVDGQLFPNPVR